VVGVGDAGLKEDVARAESKGRGWDGVLTLFASVLGLSPAKVDDVGMMSRRRRH
jgi:hypothetical protein